MSEAYKVGVEVQLEDKVTPGLKSMIDVLDEAGNKLEKFGFVMKELSTKGDGLADKLHEASKAAEELGKSHGLATAGGYLASMAAASKAIASNMMAAQQAGERMKGVFSRDSRHGGYGVGPGGITPQPKFASAEAGGAAETAVETGLTEAGGLEGAALAGGMKVAEAAGNGLVDGYKANLQLEHTNWSIIQSMQVQPPESQREGVLKELRAQEMNYAKLYGFLTNREIAPIAEARFAIAKEFNGRPKKEQDEMMEAVMPFAAFGVKQANMKLPEAAQMLSEFATKGGAQDEGKAVLLFNAAAQAAHSMAVPFDKVVEGAESASEALNAAGDKSGHFLLLIAAMEKSHMMNSESADFLNSMAKDSLPKTLLNKSPADKQRIEAGNKLGLYKKDQAQFFQGDKIDLMQLLAIIAEASSNRHIKKEELEAKLTTVFGTGELGAQVVSFVRKLDTSSRQELREMPDTKREPSFLNNFLKPVSDVEKGAQIITNENLALMNATIELKGPTTLVLDKSLKITSDAADFTEKHQDFWDSQLSSLKTKLKDDGNFIKNLFKGKLSIAPILPEKSTPPEKLLPPPPVPKARPGPVVPTPEKSRVQELLEDGSKPVDQGVNVSVYLDSKQISSYLISSTSQGPSGMNGTASLLRPGVSSLGLA